MVINKIFYRKYWTFFNKHNAFSKILLINVEVCFGLENQPATIFHDSYYFKKHCLLSQGLSMSSINLFWVIITYFLSKYSFFLTCLKHSLWITDIVFMFPHQQLMLEKLLKSCIRYIFSSLFFKSKREHLWN